MTEIGIGELFWSLATMFAWILAVGLTLFLCLGVVYLVYLRHVNKGTSEFWPATVKLDGKIAVITTNGNDIGVEAARQMAARGARIVLACSDQRKVHEAKVDAISSSHVPQVVWRHLDTSSLASVNNFVDDFVRREERLDILVMVACTGGADTRELTADGLEVTMATNHFGHFLLVNRLIGLLRKHKSSRVIVLAASAHYMLSTITPKNLNFERAKYGGLRAFAQSMLCNILMSNCLADATAHTGMTVNSFCPGMVSSAPYIRGSNFLARLYRVLLQFVTRSEEEAAKTIVYLAGSDEVADVTGGFFADCAERKMTGLASDIGLARKVWERSEVMVIRRFRLNPSSISGRFSEMSDLASKKSSARRRFWWTRRSGVSLCKWF